MRFFAIFFWVSIGAGHACAQFQAAHSLSPDGKAALYYRQISDASGKEKTEAYFRNPDTQAILSHQLIPDLAGSPLGSSPEVDALWDGKLLLESICWDNEGIRLAKERDSAFSYFVSWSPDSQWVAIDGGEHKFWGVALYHFINGRFQRLSLPSRADYLKYYRTHSVPEKVRDLGVEVLTRQGRSSLVSWIHNGVVAIDAYLYLSNEDNYSETAFPYFYLNGKTAPEAVILGFCK